MDGLTDGAEVNTHNTMPLVADTDMDGLSDGAEINMHGSNPLLTDSDMDGLSDGDEVNVHGSNPANGDSDMDGLPDGWEVAFGLDASSGADAMADGDNDQLNNLQEFAANTDPTMADTDGDRLNDGLEVNVHLTDPTLADTDMGGRPDGDEVLIDMTNPLDGSDDRVVVNLPFNLTDGSGFLWDIQRTGSINNGTSDAYDGGLNLSFNGTNFTSQTTGTAEDMGREVLIGPTTQIGLQISRKVFVPDNAGFARYLETFENMGATTITTTVSIRSNLGSDGSTVLVNTSDGNTTFALTDDWLITDDSSNGGGDPTMLHVFSGPGALVEPNFVSQASDNIEYRFVLTIPAGGKQRLMHFAAQNSDRTAANANAITLHMLQGMTLVGLDPSERTDVVNFVVP